MRWILELAAALRASLLPLPFDAWDLAAPSRTVPADLIEIADPQDPLAQSRLWGAIYRDIPRGFLVETCLLESGCKSAIGIHDVDAHLGGSAWRGVWQRQRVAHDCAFYPDPATVDDDWWPTASTRGNHGLIAAYHLPLLGRCVPFEALDVPFFSAWAAAEKAHRACASIKAKGRSCTRERLRCVWAQKRWGTKACRKVVRSYKAGLARWRRERPDVDPRTHYTLNYFRKHKHDAEPDRDADPQDD